MVELLEVLMKGRELGAACKNPYNKDTDLALFEATRLLGEGEGVGVETWV